MNRKYLGILATALGMIAMLASARDAAACVNPAAEEVTGILQTIAVDPSDGDVAYAYGQGIYKTCDGGASWHRPSTSFVGRGLLIDPDTPGTLYAGSQYDGVFISRDGGAAWSAGNAGLTEGRIDSLAKGIDGRLYAGTSAGVFTSSDRGATWSLLSGSPSGDNAYGLVTDPTTANILYVGIFRQGVYRSLDGGASWLDASAGLTDRQLFDLDIDATNPARLYATTWNGLYRSVDAGGSWQEIGDIFSASEMAISPADPMTLFVSTERRGVYRSTDGGESWQQVLGATDNDGANINFVSVAVGRGGRVYVGTVRGGVYRSFDNGENWYEPSYAAGGVAAGSGTGGATPPPAAVSSLSVRIEKYGEDESVGAGGLAKFKVTVTNTGSVAAPDVEIRIAWWREWAGRRHYYDVHVNPAHADCYEATRCRIGTLPAGAGKIIDINGETEPDTLTMYQFAVTATASDGASATDSRRVGSSITLFETSSGGAGALTPFLLLLALIRYASLSRIRAAVRLRVFRSLFAYARVSSAAIASGRASGRRRLPHACRLPVKSCRRAFTVRQNLPTPS